MSPIVIFAPDLFSKNTGDEIIVESALDQLKTIFQNWEFKNIPSQRPLAACNLLCSLRAKLKIFAGTNILVPRIRAYRQWQVGWKDVFAIRGTVFLGVGCWQYQPEPDFETRAFWKAALSRRLFHSVRDSYTKQYMEHIGINNVLNTGCPTMWSLTPDLCAEIPKKKGRDVIFTLTDYAKASEQDAKLIHVVRKNYEKVFFWPQGRGDTEYLQQFSTDGITIIGPNLRDFDCILEEQSSLDYVGTRLHAGIRALSKGRRALIVSVDNRAAEISWDTNLPIILREELEGLNGAVNGEYAIDIKMPWPEIEAWKGQFE